MVHIRSIEASLWLYRAFNAEAAHRTDVPCYPILWITRLCTALTEVTCLTVAAHSTQARFTTELARITTNTVLHSFFTPAWLVCSLRTLNWGWGTCGTVTAIWAICAMRLIKRHFFGWTSPAPEPFKALLGGNYVPCSITVVASWTGQASWFIL